MLLTLSNNGIDMIGKDGKSGYDDEDGAPLLAPWMITHEDNNVDNNGAITSSSSAHRQSMPSNGPPQGYAPDGMYHVSSFFLKVFNLFTHYVISINRLLWVPFNILLIMHE